MSGTAARAWQVWFPNYYTLSCIHEEKSTDWSENKKHIARKEDTYWEKQWHMNLCYDKQLFLYNFIHNTGIKLIYNGEP